MLISRGTCAAVNAKAPRAMMCHLLVMDIMMVSQGARRTVRWKRNPEIVWNSDPWAIKAKAFPGSETWCFPLSCSMQATLRYVLPLFCSIKMMLFWYLMVFFCFVLFEDVRIHWRCLPSDAQYFSRIRVDHRGDRHRKRK